jgi:putative DNA primase/helicase
MHHASDYVSQGLALVNIAPRTKGPETRGWNKRENVIIDVTAAAKLTNNIGLAHAYCLNGPTMALDIDDLPLARVWLNERGIHLDAYFDADDGVQINSGKPGRAKFLFRLAPGTKPLATKQVSDPETGRMILEFRCATASGLTVQDVLPPSIHPETGKPYQWAGKGSWRNIPIIPEPLLTVWRSLLTRPAPEPFVGGLSTSDSSAITLPPETIQHLRSALLSMRADDHALWIKMGMALKPLGDVGRGLWLEWSLTSEKSQDD